MNERNLREAVFRTFLKNKLTLTGLILVAVVSVIAIFAPWIAPYDPNEINPANRYAPPSSVHWLGTDDLGRDVFSRAVYGTRVSLAVGLLSVAIGMLGGAVLGTLAGYRGGALDAVAVEAANMLICIPDILLGIMILSLWGSGFWPLVLTLAFAYFPRFVRLSRGMTLSVKSRGFVEASKAIGCSDIRILVRHILPNTISENIIAGTLWVSAAILAQAGLSFLGLGIPPPTPTWGGMIKDGTRILIFAPWVSLSPGIMIMLTVIGFNMLGDGVRDVLDPRLRGII